jgi:hypothetical protein
LELDRIDHAFSHICIPHLQNVGESLFKLFARTGRILNYGENDDDELGALHYVLW